MFTMPLLITLTFIFTQLSHPLAMGLILLIQTTLISITIGISTFSFWMSYILFLVFLGGMLVLFIYVASLASNEYFMFSMSKLMITFSVFFILSLMIFSFTDKMMFSFPSTMSSSLNFYISTPCTINWIYNSSLMNFTIFIISYLLLMLIVVVKILNLFKGPLRLTY